jgi:hypothetical protein
MLQKNHRGFILFLPAIVTASQPPSLACSLYIPDDSASTQQADRFPKLWNLLALQFQGSNSKSSIYIDSFVWLFKELWAFSALKYLCRNMAGKAQIFRAL